MARAPSDPERDTMIAIPPDLRKQIGRYQHSRNYPSLTSAAQRLLRVALATSLEDDLPQSTLPAAEIPRA